MNIRPDPTARPVQGPTPAAPKAPATATPPAAAAPPAASSSFAPQRPVQGPALSDTGAAPVISPGPLPLQGAPAQAAIEKAQQAINARRGGGAPSPARSVSNAYEPRSVELDTLGMTHVRLDRSFEGVPVLGEQVVAHLDRQGEVASLSGDERAIPEGISGDFVVSGDQAKAAAMAAFEGGPNPGAPEAQQVIARDPEGTYRAAYRVQATDLSGNEPLAMNYLVDAKTGEVFESWNQIGGFDLSGATGATGGGGKAAAVAEQPGEPAEPGDARDDTTIFSGKVKIDATQNEDGSYRLEDLSRGKGVETRDARNAPLPSSNTPIPSEQINDDNDVWGEAGDPARQKAAVDAQYGAQATYDFLKDVLGRDSIDGAGEKLVSKVHVSNNFANAFWWNGAMHYGDGDGVQTGELVAVDIAGHEIVHGLTERTAGLLYRNESGALNEAFSDILGSAGVEWHASQTNQAIEFDWKVGEDVMTPGKEGDALRYMDDPTRDRRGTSNIYSRDNYNDRLQLKPGEQPNRFNDNGYVHYNSGIANNAFYLTSEGGTNRTSGNTVDGGIGIEKSLQIYGRALEFYMTPNTTFAEARQATIQAATDLFGADSAEVAKVKEGWSAVGVE